jgi:RNA polymerase-binding protein DksA
MGLPSGLMKLALESDIRASLTESVSIRSTNSMTKNWPDALGSELLQKKEELTARLERITANLRRGYEADSKERAKQLEDREVVDALGNKARTELKKITAALAQMESGEFGICINCGTQINGDRIKAYPYALECIDCATMHERRKTRP